MPNIVAIQANNTDHRNPEFVIAIAEGDRQMRVWISASTVRTVTNGPGTLLALESFAEDRPQRIISAAMQRMTRLNKTWQTVDAVTLEPADFTYAQ